MMKVNSVVLENGQDYIIIAEKKHNDFKYVYLVNEDNSDDFCIRKVIMEDDEEILSGLDDEKEFNLAVSLFNEK